MRCPIFTPHKRENVILWVGDKVCDRNCKPECKIDTETANRNQNSRGRSGDGADGAAGAKIQAPQAQKRKMAAPKARRGVGLGREKDECQMSH